MPRRRVTQTMLLVLTIAALPGCVQPATEPKANGNPYKEGREIIQYIRMQTGDPEASVEEWGPREVVKSDSSDGETVIIQARYQASVQHVPGAWSQKFRVKNRQVSEETERLPAK